MCYLMRFSPADVLAWPGPLYQQWMAYAQGRNRGEQIARRR